MKKLKQLIGIMLIVGFALPTVVHAVESSPIINFHEPNLPKLKNKLVNVKNKVAPPDSVLRITQLGDSHTAADIFTGALRQSFQQDYGSAGIGWISPINVYGQRNTQVYYNALDWRLTSSRSTVANDYPMGGFIATPTVANAQLTINYNVDEKPSLWNATFLVKQLKKGKPLKLVDGMNYEVVLDTKGQTGWQYVSAFVMLPLTITAESAESAKLGGIWLEKNGAPGVVVSPVALNGAKQSIWTHWRSDWTNDLAKIKSDLIIIAYGTNEAFETPFNPVKYKQFLIDSIKAIRKKSPTSVILIVSPPDSMLRNKIKRGASCQAMQPPNLSIIRKVQKEVAKQQHTLYWDWSVVMGGMCGMRNWVAKGLGNKDHIHLTASGYQQSADQLYKSLSELLR
ncbi:hypothetical protein DKL61_00510 [Gammaproteobacteria bacterium ESL0073]|nr:hypothetical protein DKL61_00510 [Gammaproteobacteria bacterium ESL0073]